MKVLLVNGSPREQGCTYTALEIAAKALRENQVEAEIFQVGKEPMGGCTACHACRKLGRCFMDDCVNRFAELAKDADGFIFGSPVHYAAISGNMTAFLDRLFFSAGGIFRHKPGAAVLSARRGGTTAAYDQMNKYFGISQMPIISSTYWNMVHGSKPEDVLRDEEGIRCMRQLGKNMAYWLTCRKMARDAGILPPEDEPPAKTDFIR